ncbi:MAG: hypothetical protein M3N32_07935 [Actinomycetota bacterium]|nr:hypothetical protein [Actinomycetota bacterium]
MPILTIQQRLAELGRIRVGAKTGKGHPKKLEQFRFTSPSQRLIEAVAELYGGEVQEWEGAPTDGAQWEVFTAADSINVVLPPNEFVSQWMELWSGGGIKRRCDGTTETLSMKPCLCDPDPADRECSPTTRLRVMLPEVAGVGVWRLETHSYHAAAELAGVAQLLAAATAAGKAIPASLRLEQREKRVSGKATLKYAVPRIDVHAPLGAVLEAVGVESVLAPPERAAAPLSGRRQTQREPLPAGPELAPPAQGGPDEPGFGPAPAPQAKAGEKVDLPPAPPPPPEADFEPPKEEIPASAPANGKPPSDQQIRAIHTLASKRGLIEGRHDEDYRNALWARYGKNSSKELTSEEASDFIDWLQKGEQ